MDVDPPSHLVVRRQAPSARPEYAVYPPSAPSYRLVDSARRAANADAARARRSAIHFEKKDSRASRIPRAIVPFNEQIDEDYHEEL